MNTNVMFSSNTGVWETPIDFFKDLDDEFHFTLDACALLENHKVSNFYDPEMDGLKQPWIGRVWCNPPYGRGIDKWVEKAYYHSKVGDAIVVLLVPARTDTKWFHRYIYNNPHAEIRFIQGRLKFGNSNNSAPFPSMVVIFRPWFYTKPIINRLYNGNSFISYPNVKMVSYNKR